MQDGFTPAYIASQNGHTETLALLLANNAVINEVDKVNEFKILKCLYMIDNEFQDFKIAFFILLTI